MATAESITKPKRQPPIYTNLQAIQELARSKEGKCLSDVYINSRTKLVWECTDGHVFEMRSNDVQSGTWCPQCYNTKKRPFQKRIPIEVLQNIARERGGKCLSEICIGMLTKHVWECAKGHQWAAVAESVRQGYWCKQCADTAKGAKRRKYTIEDMQALAESKGGRCLSEKFFAVGKKLRWACTKQHEWESTPWDVQSGKWCKECRMGHGEKICRAFFEQIFEVAFPKERPAWLRGEKGWPLELDGFSAQLGIAFEHQGKQHFEYNPFFYRDEETFRKAKEKDVYKYRVCKNNGVALIQVPSVLEILGIEKLRSFLKMKLNDLGVKIPKDFDTKPVNLEHLHLGQH